MLGVQAATATHVSGESSYGTAPCPLWKWHILGQGRTIRRSAGAAILSSSSWAAEEKVWTPLKMCGVLLTRPLTPQGPPEVARPGAHPSLPPPQGAGGSGAHDDLRYTGEGSEPRFLGKRLRGQKTEAVRKTSHTPRRAQHDSQLGSEAQKAGKKQSCCKQLL